MVQSSKGYDPQSLQLFVVNWILYIICSFFLAGQVQTVFSLVFKRAMPSDCSHGLEWRTFEPAVVISGRRPPIEIKSSLHALRSKLSIRVTSCCILTPYSCKNTFKICKYENSTATKGRSSLNSYQLLSCSYGILSPYISLSDQSPF